VTAISGAPGTLRPGRRSSSIPNRLQNLPQADGTTRLNHPLLYPYDPGEEVLEWGVDLAQDTARTNTAYDLYATLPKSFSIIRVSVIK